MADTSDKYVTKTLSTDPADYITGPVGGQANRGNGGTGRDGTVQVVRIEEPSGK